METTSNIVGIDYSTTSPSICVKVGDNWDIHFLTLKKTLADEYWHQPFLFFGQALPKIPVTISRYKYISSWAMDVIKSYDVSAVILEDYAYAATGRVFNIGENTGILKYRLLQNDIPFYEVPPTVIKKYATGKGNANKEMMISNFITTTGVNIHDVMNYAGDYPISDIVDSFFICEYAINNSDEIDCPIIQSLL
jgi:Holliday junction resolvasome RuvABC endonuclease subunit|tara:strand:- start:3026 stop:3607 length:582 start_codon:yes stop_codon:yes gene_type:complete